MTAHVQSPSKRAKWTASRMDPSARRRPLASANPSPHSHRVLAVCSWFTLASITVRGRSASTMCASVVRFHSQSTVIAARRYRSMGTAGPLLDLSRRTRDGTPDVETRVDSTLARRLELLDGAGFSADPDGLRFEVEAVILEDATVRRVSETIRQMLEQIGIRLKFTTVPGFADFYARLREHPQAFISKWFWPEPVDAIIGFIASWGRDGGPNFQGSSNAAIDSACHAWEIATTDEAQRDAAAELDCSPPKKYR